jgi:hypothetical protein
MHVVSQDSSKDGRKHLLSTVIEADGASELASAKSQITARVISGRRTASGGIAVEVEILVREPGDVVVAPATVALSDSVVAASSKVQ